MSSEAATATKAAAGGGMEIPGSVVLVTGAAQGLGKAFAQSLLQKGAKVCLADFNEEILRCSVQELTATHGSENVTFAKCDVTKDQDLEGAWTLCEETLGPITILVNNAGIGNEQKWQQTLDVNVGGCIRGTLMALHKMGANRGGAGGVVVNVSSIAGVKNLPLGPVYSATKHAIVGFSRALGHDLHHAIYKVKVQCLCPSLVNTQLLAASISNAFSPEVAEVMKKYPTNNKMLTVEDVANSLLKLLEEGRNGGVLVVESNKEPYYVSPALT